MIDRLQYISQATREGNHLDAIEEVLDSGGKWIQLRIKNQTEEQVLKTAIEARFLCERYGAKLIVNDYPLVAKKAGCSGVHLGLQDLSIAEARKIVGPEMIIGGTANTFEHILQRHQEGADYIGLGPYRFTNTKQNLSPIIGLPGYKILMKGVHEAGLQIPIVAIGGIEITDVNALLNAGVYGVAVSGALTNQNDLAAKMNQLRSLII